METPDRIRLAIKALGVSQGKIAEKSGLSRQHLSAFLTGRYGANKHLPDIAQALGVSVEWLTTGDPAMAPSWANIPPQAQSNPSDSQLPPMPEALAARIAQVLGMTPIEVRAWGSTRSGVDSMTATLNALTLHDDLARERAARERAEAALAAELAAKSLERASPPPPEQAPEPPREPRPRDPVTGRLILPMFKPNLPAVTR